MDAAPKGEEEEAFHQNYQRKRPKGFFWDRKE